MRRIARRPIFRFTSAGILAALMIFLMVACGGGDPIQDAGSKPNVENPSELPTMPVAEREQRFHPGPPWQGKGNDQGISQAEAENFADYPLFWLGESFAGYNLQSIVRQKYTPPPGVPAHEAMDSVGFSYGDCTIQPGSQSCPAPLVVMIESACLEQPERLANAVKDGPMESVRGGAQLQRFHDGHVRLWTGQVSMFLMAPADPSLVDRMVQELHGIGINRAALAGTPLSAPDFSGCPPIDIAPLNDPTINK